MNSGSRAATSSLWSTKAAVVPPTMTWLGSSSRSLVTSSEVSSACGVVVGTTVSSAASPCSLRCGSDTKATPSVSRIVVTASSSAPGSVVATSSGPLEPGPKPRLIMS